MALTPEDVVNKRFQPTKFREGYDQDEVDDFLDEIVVELRRLNQENDELRQKLTGGSPAGTPATSEDTATAIPAPVAASSSTGVVASDEKATGTPTAAETPTSAAVVPATSAEPVESAAPAASVPSPASSSAESAAGVLAMAQRLHDEYVTAGVEQRDRIIAEAQIEATGLVDDAEEKSRKTLGDLEEQKSLLERKVEQLRGFESDYRNRLRAYIEGQLRDLDNRGPVASDAPAS